MTNEEKFKDYPQFVKDLAEVIQFVKIGEDVHGRDIYASII